MKSKEAKEFIDGCMDHLTVEMTDHAKCRAGSRGTDAAKAVEAFKSSCKYKDDCGGIGRDCHPVLCEDLRSFIQKLNEI